MKYNTVYIGYPIWWGIAAWPVNNFVKGNDFTGKTVIPFCTSASSGIGDSGTLLAEMAGTGDWQDGQRFSSGASVSDVEDWVASLTVGNTVTMFMGLSVVLTGILLVLVKPVVAAMSTPTEAVSETVMYLRICFIGIPVALQDGFIQIAFIVITIIANRRGLNDVAAVGIVEKIIGVVFLVPSTMLSTVSTLSAQNIGAGKHERASATLRYAILITVIFGVIVAAITQFMGRDIVGLFSDDREVIRLGDQYLRSYIVDCPIAGIHFCFSGYFCAYGLSGISFLHNVLSIVFVRIPGAYLTSMYFPDTLYPMGFAAPCGSELSVMRVHYSIARIRRSQRKSGDKRLFADLTKELD